MRISIFVSLILMFWLVEGYPQTLHTISIDGVNDFQEANEQFVTSTEGYNAYFTWDDENLYFGYSGQRLINNPADTTAILRQSMWWYIDTDPQADPRSGLGSDTSLNVYVNIVRLTQVPVYNRKLWTLPFNADYCLSLSYPATHTGQLLFVTFSNDSMNWSIGQYLDSTLAVADTSNGYVEVALPRSLIGNAASINIMGYILSAEFLGEIYFENNFPQRDLVGSYASWPPGSQDGGDGDKKTHGSFSQWFHYDLTDEIAPNSPEYFVSDGISVRAKVFLEGAYNSGTGLMNTILCDNLMLPDAQPFNTLPWNYAGSETPPFMPSGLADWVLLELRKNPTPSAEDIHQAAFVKADGSLVDLDGQFPVAIEAVPDDYYLVIRHRNHLPVMSAAPLPLNGSSASIFDFSSGINQYYDGGAKEISPGIWGMFAGDIDQDGEITTADYTQWYNSARAGDSGYLPTDSDLEMQVTTSDYTLWYNNARAGASSTVPK